MTVCSACRYYYPVPLLDFDGCLAYGDLNRVTGKPMLADASQYNDGNCPKYETGVKEP